MYADSLSQPSCSSRPNLLDLVQGLVKTCISGSNDEQRISAQLVDNEISNHAEMDGVIKFYGGLTKGKSGARDASKALFRAIEVCEDDLALILFCRIANGLISDETTNVSAKRHKRLVKADVCSSLIRGLRSRLRGYKIKPMGLNESPIHINPLAEVATDALASLLLVYGAKDARLTMKMRVIGVLSPICDLFSCDINYSPSPTLLRLLCRAVRSPRNAQLCGRQKDFARRLLFRISVLDECNDGPSLMLLARHLEILYFITKNKKTRLQLIQEDIVRRIMAVVDSHLETRKKVGGACFSVVGVECSAAEVHSELCLVSLALLRLLANNKKAKDELMNHGAVAMCERYVGSLSNEDVENIPTVKQLQDSLCSLCLRCLPTVKFPLAGVGFPIRFPVPRSSSPKRRSLSTAKSAKSNGSPAATSPLKSKSFEDASMSSDDDGLDEEDEVFGGLDDSEILRSDEEEDEEKDDTRKKGGSITYLKQKHSELVAYDAFFREKDGARITSRGSWKTYENALQLHVQSTCSVVPFVKIACPEWSDPNVDQPKQLLISNRDSMKDVVVQRMAQSRLRAPFTSRVVFDLDALFAGAGPLKSLTPSDTLQCTDSSRVSKLDNSCDHLLFESRFESGNLRRATQIGHHHYELVLSPDINQAKDHYQWFYFEVSNMKANIPYTFEIVNCLKTTSMYSRGMQPVMYSVRDRLSGKAAGWSRVGDSVCYYRNLYTGADEVDSTDGEKLKKKNFFSIRFNVTFRNKGDICYLAYHYPYTYSYMKTSVDRCLSRLSHSVFCQKDTIGFSLGGNPIYMLTVTAPGSAKEVAARESCVLTARVHPGESNASWMMHGILELLLCSQSASTTDFLSRFVVKIIPMLNPDGVINGSHRCSLIGTDLNRVWDKPSRTIHPEIFHSKGIIQYLTEIRGQAPWMFVDLHGHSRRSNVFLFGNNPEESYRSEDRQIPHCFEFMELPEILEQNSAGFAFKNCRFSVVRAKECSARVAIWRQFGTVRSYTMEATYCGFETGAYRGYQIGISELKEMGRELISAILQCHQAKDQRKKTSFSSRKARPSSLSETPDDRKINA